MKKLPRNYEKTVTEFKLLSQELNGKILDRSFYNLPFKERWFYIRRIKHLYNKLRGPISEVKLKQLVAATAVLALIVPFKFGTDPKSAPVSLLMACRLAPGGVNYGSSIAQFAIPKTASIIKGYDLTVSGPGM
ncbi:MAG TPA: hypothetical protein ENI27_09645, partial [bacterium]|nr:hypothetical protein [bacterium]